MSGSREHVLHYSGPLLHKETQLVAQPAATSGLCPASEDKRGHGPPAPAHLLSHWSKSGPGGPDSSVPAGVPRAFQTFQVKPHGTLWTTALHSCPESGGISLRGSIVGGAAPAGTSVSTSGDMGVLPDASTHPGGRRRARAPALLDDGQGPWCGGGSKGWNTLINKEPRAQDAVKAREM